MEVKGIDIRLVVGVGREKAGKNRKDWKYFNSHTDNVHEFKAFVQRELSAMLTDVCDNLVQKGVLKN